ncbi:MAG: CBS domain-containing protein [Acidimicrobiia bacterium]
MSPRAACRLERLGFEVYDYVLSKVDWLAAGLPTERAERAAPRVSLVLETNVATCPPTALVRDLRAASDAREWIVVTEERVVLGRLRIEGDSDPDVTAEEVMHPGPTTVRAHEDLAKTWERMTARKVKSILVTTPEGVLLGVVDAPTPHLAST